MADDLITVAEDSARGSFFLFSGTALSTLVLAISSIVVARLVGPESFGQYSLSFVVPQLLFIFTDLGINQGITKFAAEYRLRNEETLSAKMIKHGVFIRALMGIIMFVIGYFFAEQFATILFQRPELAFYVRIASISILFQAIFTIANAAFVGLDKTEYNAITTNIQAIAKALISILLVLSGFAVTGAILGHVASYIVGAATGLILLIVLLRKKQNGPRKPSFVQNTRVLFHYGAPLYVFALLTAFIPFFQNIILALFTSDDAIGNYKAAVNFATLLTVLSIPITTALLPAFSKLSSASNNNVKNFFRLSNKYTSIIILPATFLIVIFSTQIVQIIYGATYTTAPSFLATYCLMYFLVGLGSLNLGSFYNGLGETGLTLKMGIASFLTLISLSPLLTKAYGVQGLIVAYLMAMIVGTAYGSYKARKKFGVEFSVLSLVKIYLLSAIAAPLPALLNIFLPSQSILTLFFGSFLYLFLYMTLFPLTKVITDAEMQTIGIVLKKIRLIAPLVTLLIRYQQKLKTVFRLE